MTCRADGCWRGGGASARRWRVAVTRRGGGGGRLLAVLGVVSVAEGRPWSWSAAAGSLRDRLQLAVVRAELTLRLRVRLGLGQSLKLDGGSARSTLMGLDGGAPGWRAGRQRLARAAGGSVPCGGAGARGVRWEREDWQPVVRGRGR